MARRIARVFFDLGGTLVRVRGSAGAVYAECAARHGVQADAFELERAFRAALAVSPPACFPGVAPHAIAARERAWWRDVVLRTFAGRDRFDDFDRFFDAVFARFARADAWKLLPGASAALAALQAEGRRLGVVSEMDSRAYGILEGLGVRAYFDPIVLSTEHGAVKQDGGLFAVALRLAGEAPAVCVHVGDSPTADGDGARCADITPLLVLDDDALAGIAARIRALETD
jgi:putative hydrolase of the HAD superfamily